MNWDEFVQRYHIRLNEQQTEAVRAVDGPVLLLAVPGSGKTTVLVTRLGYMTLCCGIRPENILTLTYTVAATRDMAARFRTFFGEEAAAGLQFRTINGVCAGILAFFGRSTGKTMFSLVTQEKDTAGMLGQIFQRVTGEYATEADLRLVRTQIAYIKNMMLTPQEIAALDDTLHLKISHIYRLYQEQMRKDRRMDYDDQMVHALAILQRYPQVLEYIRSRYQYICVDEAQDTSRIQHEIIALLAGEQDNLFMVGDEDQSIYGFRAAYPQALLEFGERHPGARILLMEENFRSDANIVAAADNFIRKNTLRHEKQMRTGKTDGAQVHIQELKSRAAQYSWLRKVAESPRAKTAVLYRDNDSMIPLADLLERERIPFSLRSADFLFFTSRIVQDVKDIIGLAYAPKNADAFFRVYYKLGTYLSRKQAEIICAAAKKEGAAVIDTALSMEDELDLSFLVMKNLRSLRTHLKNMKAETASAAISRITRFMGYGDYLDNAGIGDGKLQILRILAFRVSSPEDLLDRLDYLQNYLSEKENDPGCRFILSTIHSSKGLEYDAVYLMDVVDGIFPAERPQSLRNMTRQERELYEEERRLFYVGMTRAKSYLCVFRIPGESIFIEQLEVACGRLFVRCDHGDGHSAAPAG